MPIRKLALPITIVLGSCGIILAWPAGAKAQSAPSVTQVCKLSVSAPEMVASGAARRAAGKIAQPPLTDTQNGFAWPDTPLGVVKTPDGSAYEFFGSDGACHSADGKCPNPRLGKYGSATRTVGTLDSPLGSDPPLNISIRRNPDPTVDPNYDEYDYMGGGPVIRIPSGLPGAGNLLMVYHAEIPTNRSFYSLLALASSSDEGASWTDIGEIVRINQSYARNLDDGFDIGNEPLVISPDGNYFYIYFRDWIANGTTKWGNSVTLVSVARAPIAAVLDGAFGGTKSHAARFEKYYKGGWNQPGIGGLSTDLNPDAQFSGNLDVVYNSDLQRYVMIVDEGVLFAYAESPDGLSWTLPVVLHYYPDGNFVVSYAVAVGTGDDPRTLGNPFYVYFTHYPTNGTGWHNASVGRFTVSCK